MTNVLLFLSVGLLLFCVMKLYSGVKILDNLLTPRSIITFLFYGVATYLALKQLPLPPWLNDIIFTMQGFWFGSKVTQQPQQPGGPK